MNLHQTQTAKANATLAARFRNTFKPRELFLHDGRSLKRMKIGSRVQMAAAGALAGIVAWSGFATVSVAATMNSDVAQMQQQVTEMQQQVEAIRAEASQRAQAVEQRQAVLQAVLAGNATPDQVSALMPTQATPGATGTEVAEAYESAEAMQARLAGLATQVHQQRLQAATQAVRQLGLDPQRFNGVGGPFEEATASGPANADPRFQQLFNSWRELERLEASTASIPSIMPVQGIRFTSGFGTRSDPFRGRAAMHAGIDMAGPIGTPIYATADGIVGRAGGASGYGNLIELQHGAGIATRYGHLSRILVEEGARVRRGQLIGLMGSTGRSTGSHLHYEVRIDGRAVNAMPFLQSGQALAALQGRGGQGGPAGASQ